MTNQRALHQKSQRLADIGQLMTAMKNMAFMETRKLERRVQAQGRMVEQIQQSTELCISHFPEALPHGHSVDNPVPQLWLLIGSERGFCGDFNQRLAQQSKAQLQHSPSIVSIGQRLNQRAMPGVTALAQLPGANTTEETDRVLIQLTQTLSELEQQQGSFQLSVLFNQPDSNQISRQKLLPPFQDLRHTAPQGVAPLIHLDADSLLLGLGQQYLFVRLQHILYLSLMAENQQRIVHLQGAIQKLEQQLDDLQRRVNRLRQEEIIEEIEIILINQGMQTPLASTNDK